MLLKNLLDSILVELDPKYLSWEIKDIYCDSRKVTDSSVFVALKGIKFDGNRFIQAAIDNGAIVIITDKSLKDLPKNDKVCFISVADSKRCLRSLVKKFYIEKVSPVRCIGVTGTNGKTTVVHLIEFILNNIKKPAGVSGTLGQRLGSNVILTQNTTQGYLENHQFIHQLAKKKVPYCLMEVSSHGLDQGRVDNIKFKEAVFINLSPDHLDYHKTMEAYFSAKSKMFLSLKSDSTAIINIDDVAGQKLTTMLDSNLTTFGIDSSADVVARDIDLHEDGCGFSLQCPKGTIDIRSNLIGKHNVYNTLAAVAVALAEGISLEVIKDSIESFTSVPGRLEKVFCGQEFSVFIDYAHTPDALKNVLMTLKEFSKGKIILVFGCGGDRDKSKRVKMGQIANELADYTFITSDNPRGEEPKVIIEEIEKGFQGNNFESVVNRKEAIHKSLAMAESSDIVLIAGKGHETYQIVKSQRLEFKEADIIKEYFHA